MDAAIPDRLVTASWCVAIVGMNGVGKSNFGRELARKLHLNRIDSDALFKQRHGDHLQHIAAHGEESLRALEEALILESLRPGNLVVTSGGAIESAAVRVALKERAAVVWLKAGLKRVVRNLSRAKDDRHEFRDGEMEEVARSLLERRHALYQEVACVTLGEGLRYRSYIPVAIGELRRHYARKP